VCRIVLCLRTMIGARMAMPLCNPRLLRTNASGDWGLAMSKRIDIQTKQCIRGTFLLLSLGAASSLLAAPAPAFPESDPGDCHEH
jgi:hypothetical protein